MNRSSLADVMLPVKTMRAYGSVIFELQEPSGWLLTACAVYVVHYGSAGQSITHFCKTIMQSAF